MAGVYVGPPCAGQELRKSFLGFSSSPKINYFKPNILALSPVPSSAAGPVQVDRHKPHWQQKIMRMVASLPGDRERKLPVFVDVVDHIGIGGHFAGPSALRLS